MAGGAAAEEPKARFFHGWPDRQVLAVYGLIAALVAALSLAGWTQRDRVKVPLLTDLEGQMVDWQLRQRGPVAPSSPVGISILTLDDRSAEIGGVALDRRTLAMVVERLSADGAAWTGFDVLFTDASRQDPADDQRLARAIASAGNVVLPYALPESVPSAAMAAASGTGAQVPAAVLKSAYQRYSNEARAAAIRLHPSRVLAPIPLLADAARGLGHVSVSPGVDGAVRQDLPALPLDGELYPSMAITVAALASGVAPATLEARLGDAVVMGPRRVPLDPKSQLWVNYLGPRGSFPTHALADLLDDRLPPGSFKGRIVLIGSSALGTGDRYQSAFDAVLPGVERMATVIDNVLSNRWLERPAWALTAEMAGILVLPFLAVLAIARLTPLRSLGLVVLAAAACIAASQAAFAQHRQIVSPVFPLFALVLSAGLALAWRALLYERARRAAELQLRASEERFALAARGANDGLWDWDIAGRQTYFSPRARQLMDLPDSPTELSFDQWVQRLDTVERERLQQQIQDHLAGRTQQLHHELRHSREGEPRWLLVRGVAVREGDTAVRMAGSLTDITDAKRLENQISFDSLHDRLTGLANRELFADRLGQWLGAATPAAAEEARAEVGLALIDIDGFRQINEVHGHVTGNQVLVEAAGRLSQLMQARPEGGLVARVGPDQYALATQGSLELLVELGRAAQKSLAAPFAALSQTPESAAHPSDKLGLSVTLALAHTEHQLDGVDELLNGASLALAQAKRSGRGIMRSFDPAEQALQNSRRWLDENIDLALAAGGQFQLHYQPFVRLSDRVLIGFEALIRWQHPQRGMVMPNDFIPHAEQSGRINAIGQWTMFEAARQLVAWDAIGFQGEIAVNLSGRQFTETDLEADARQVLAMLGDVAPRRYKLEVTESMAMENPQRTAKVLNRLADLGFKISIDDFGTGYSSLAYLHRFPFDTLKIDRSFVIRLGSGREAQEIVRTIVGLGAALEKQVLAEGVEDEPQAQQLQALGVQIGQGWLFARALPVPAATELIGKWAQPAA